MSSPRSSTTRRAPSRARPVAVRAGGTPVGVAGSRKADRVADDLLEQVVAGRIPVGSTLPRENDLAEHYGVNRGVVREAIKLLEVHGLVLPARKRGTLVLDPMASISPRVLRAMLMPGGGRVDRAVLRNLLEIRAVLDVDMSTRAAEHRTDADLRDMEAALVVLEASVGDQHAYTTAFGRFSLAIARASGNVLFRMLASWHQAVTSELDAIFAVARPANQQHLQGLQALLVLLRERDVENVRALVAGFHAWATPRLLAAAALSNGDPMESILETPP